MKSPDRYKKTRKGQGKRALASDDVKNSNWLKRAKNPTKSIDNGDGTKSTHKMAYGEITPPGTKKRDRRYIAYPTIREQEDGTLKELSPREAQEAAYDKHDAAMFSREKDAKWFSEKGYKKLTGMNKRKYATGGKVTFQDARRAKMGPYDNTDYKKYPIAPNVNGKGGIDGDIPEYAAGGIIGAAKALFKGGKAAAAGAKSAKAASAASKGIQTGAKAGQTASKGGKFIDKFQKYSEMAQSMGGSGGGGQQPVGEQSISSPQSPIHTGGGEQREPLDYDPGMAKPIGTRRYRAGTGYYRHTENYGGPTVYRDDTPTWKSKNAKMAKAIKNAPLLSQVGKALISSGMKGATDTPNSGAAEGSAKTIAGSGTETKDTTPAKTAETPKSGGLNASHYFTSNKDKLAERKQMETDIQNKYNEEQAAAAERERQKNIEETLGQGAKGPTITPPTGENKGRTINIKDNIGGAGSQSSSHVAKTDWNQKEFTKLSEKISSGFKKRKGSKHVKPMNLKKRYS